MGTLSSKFNLGMEQKQDEGGGAPNAALSIPNWIQRELLLEECLVGVGVLLRDLVGLVDEYCGKQLKGEGVALTGHTSFVNSVCAVGDGHLASGSAEKTIRIWDLSKGGECVQTLTGHTAVVNSVCALGDGRLASGSADKTIRVWDLSKGGKCVQTLTGHTHIVLSVCALGDGRLSSGSDDNSLRIWC